MDVVTIQKWKRPAGSASWRGYVLEQDSLGCWVFTPAHSIYTGVHPDGHKEICEVAQDEQLVGRSCVVLLPAGGWYVAHWVWRAERAVDIDIATPPLRVGDVWMYDDLELDPYVDADGTFGVDDEDEFDRACASGVIGRVARAHAVEEVRTLQQKLADPSAELLHAGATHLADGRRLELPALR